MTNRNLKLKDDGPRAYRGLGIAARKGETLTPDDDAQAELLLETGYFEEVEAGGVDVAETQPADAETVETESNTVRESAPEAEAEAGRDPNDGEEFDEDSWFDLGYRERASAVESGEADEYLAEIAEAESSDTVLDAVADRRDAIDMESEPES